MEREAFENRLRDEGFDNTVLVERDANGHLDDHSHPFEALALILSGEITIRTQKESLTYRNGEVFHLMADEPHYEAYGPEGVRYLVGRR